MKKLWVKADGEGDWGARKERVTSALEAGADAVWVNEGEEEKVRQLGNITVISEGEKADLTVGKVVSYTVISDKSGQEKVMSDGKSFDYVAFDASDWKVIPLENIIASLQKEKAEVVVEVSSAEEAKTVFETMEVGADAVLFAGAPIEISKVKSYIESLNQESMDMVSATVSKVKSVGMGDRVCVDTASMFEVGEGMLVGSQSNGLFLVHSETLESEYVASRPFRVNAGAVHAYTLVPGGKTKYLSDLGAGDEVLAVDCVGNTRNLIVGRLKIEKRPLMLVEARVGERTIKTLLQNAETINLVSEDGSPVSVVKLKEGDKVLAYVEEGGRHFGMKVEESIEEK